MTISSQAVHITQHAVEQLLIRYPDELLPRRPEDFLRHLVSVARPLRHQELRWLTSWPALLHPSQRLLTTSRWVLVIRPERRPEPTLRPWVLVTVLSRDYGANLIPRALREDRIINAQAFASGAAFMQLGVLVAELNGTGSTSPEAVARAWRERRYPRHEHGGFNTFLEFARDAARCGVVTLDERGLLVRAASREISVAAR